MRVLDRSVLIENKVQFVILGTDDMAYSLAHIVHENYWLKPTLFGAKAVGPTEKSKILNRIIIKNFRDDDVFVNSLIDYAKKNADKKLILLPIADIYTGRLTKHKDVLKDYYYFSVNDPDVEHKLLSKVNFYDQCQKLGLDYPKTVYCKPNEDLPYGEVPYPLVAKYANSAMFRALSGTDIKKVYFIYSDEELKAAMDEIYSNGYTDDVVLQEFIPGKPTHTFSMNAFSDSTGKVRMMALGRVLLYDIDPTRIGNNNAIYTLGNQELFKKYESFLNALGYKGFANFDVKYDPRDHKYKALEINIRFPASMGFVDCGGAHFVDFYVREALGIKYDQDVYYHSDCERIWLNCHPKLLKKHVEAGFRDLCEDLLKKGPYYSQYYINDRSLKRWLKLKKRQYKTLEDFKRYEDLPRE